jgi:hypothetical protein
MPQLRFLIFLFFLSLPVSASDYGTTGLIDIPTARMSSDGTFTTTAAIQSKSSSYAVSYQATPWLEATFRYTGFNEFHYYDRNYAAKLRLWPEQDYIPQVAVGIRDIVGTGIFGSEYLVASKAYKNFDFTYGIGWGRLAGSGVVANPMKLISDSFAKREKELAGLGATGVFQPGTFFSGPMVGFFGGASYKMESLPLTLMVEYNPDKYDFQIRNGGTGPKSAWSAGVAWDVTPGVKLSFSRQHNDQWGFNLMASLDTKSSPPQRQKPYFTSSLNTPAKDLPPRLNRNSWYDMMLYDAERSGLILVEASIDSSSQIATIVMGNKEYPIWNDAVSQMQVLANLHLPKEVKSFRFVIEEEGHQVHTFFSERPSNSQFKSDQFYARKGYVSKVLKLDNPQHETSFRQNKVFIDANISTRVQLFDPDDPARYQVYAKLGISYVLPDDWSLRGNYSLDIDNTFDEILRESDSVLPHVRSDVARYLNSGGDGLDSLFLEKRGSLSAELHYRLYGGVLEEMYSGFGGELLYQPYQSRLAFSVSGNRVQQRDYDKSFDLLDYKANTAFASVFWATPFYNYDVALHVGQYLAGDNGATIEVRRTFSNGWMVGMWGTLTTVPFKEFGEGSFDKGMYFRIPFNGFLGRNVRSNYSTRVRPIQRDGGARLEDFSGNIWWDLRGVRYDDLNSGRGHRD